jgi:ribose transport system permease protein
MAAASTTVDARPARHAGRVVRRHAWTVGVLVLLGVLLWYQRDLNPNWSSFDVQTLAIAAVPAAFAAMAQAVIIIGGGVDLSIGAQMALINVISARWMAHHGFGRALLLCFLLVLVGIGIGLLTGLIIGISGVPDIVVTLASSFVWSGVALLILGFPGGGAPTRFTNLAQVDTWGSEWIPASIVIMLVLLLVIWLPLRRSRFGLAIYAIGSSRSAAALSGVSIFRTRMLAYGVGGIFTACAGLAVTATTGTGDATAGGNYYTLNSVAAAVLGGVSLAGGIGGLIGPAIGACIFSLVPSILLLKNVDPNWAQVIQGSLLIGVVMVAGLVLVRRRA